MYRKVLPKMGNNIKSAERERQVTLTLPTAQKDRSGF